MNRDVVLDIFNAALHAADPYHAIMSKVSVSDSRMIIDGTSFDLNRFDRIVVVGAGKATASMARAIEEILGDRIDEGLIIVKYGHAGPLKRIKQAEAAHPVPDQSGVRAATDLIDIVKRADEKTLVICLLSGGASSLLVSPCEGISLEDKQAATGLLLKAGATIDELNSVRKHISKVKGGRLAELAYPAALVTLILSDVIGDKIDVIASGPTVPDGSTYQDAFEVVRKYGLKDKMPINVYKIMEDGLRGKLKDTPKGGEEFFGKTTTVIIGSIKSALVAARETSESKGFKTEIITSEIEGEARDVSKYLATRAMEKQVQTETGGESCCLLSGGETTVTVRGGGLGGRNQELALAFAREIEGKKGITMLSAGTDGTDGPTDAAGAIVDGETCHIARQYGINPLSYLDDNDSWHFFKRLDSVADIKHHLITGPTGTNVMDIQIVFIRTQ